MIDFVVKRNFPLPRIQTGAVLGNSYLGVMVWGGGSSFNISLGCSALWDHRGGMEWTEKQNLKNIHARLLAQDIEGMRELFRNTTASIPGQPNRPSLVPVGRVAVNLKEGCRLENFQLHITEGLLEIYYDCNGENRIAALRLDMEDKGNLAVYCSDIASFEVKDSYSMSNGALEKISIPAPELLKSDDGEGFVNSLPVDPGFGVFAKRFHHLLSIRFDRDADMAALKERLLNMKECCWSDLEKENKAWWGKYWSDIPKTRIGNPALEELYWFGLYKFGAMTDCSGWPAGLQGPWIEDNDFPPWSGDYHFNINIEMCYWPAFRANRPDNLKPVFKMLTDWLPRLRQYARHFVNIDDGIMLPHAVDDHGTCMGGFWTGCIDHACAAWMVQMMYDYCDYYSDEAYLRDTVFDFMKGVMRVFQEMIVRKEDGSLELTVSSSPEYRGCSMNAWGANSSFQLAAIHRLAENLITAAGKIGAKCDPFWHEVLEKLPKASIWGEGEGPKDIREAWLEGGAEIGLWDGLTLKESHRHHSHLAGICPFDTLDLEDPAWQHVFDNTRKRWIANGMGQWSGWSMPWAAMLHCRLHGAEAAELMLEIYKRTYTNEGGASLHDTAFSGFSLMGEWGRSEVMQMDAAMGAVAAIQDMFVQSRRNVLYVGAGIPKWWEDAGVEKMPAPGGFRVSCDFKRGRCSRLEFTATRDNVLKLHLPVSEKRWKLPGNAELFAPGKVAIPMKKGETLVLEN
ncbi:MAG: hypothetical protein IJV93_01450 [Lentisphaeria bacterium]|nr:hypothetical protein [Lentisphaeria bacterium]